MSEDVPSFDIMNSSDEGDGKNKGNNFSVKQFLDSANINLADFNFDKYVSEAEGLKDKSDFDSDTSNYTFALLEKLILDGAY